LLAGRLVNRLDRRGDEAPLGVAVEKVAVLPRATMGGCLVPAPDYLAGELRRLVDALTDHEGTELHMMLVREVQEARNTLVDAVLKEAAGAVIRLLR
jgi:hypothetical protein